MSESDQDNKLPADRFSKENKLPVSDSHAESLRLKQLRTEQSNISSSVPVKKPVPGVPAPVKTKPAAGKQAKPAVKKPDGKKARRRLPLWARIILKTLRILVVPVLCVAALYVGLVVGYEKIGGQDASDVMKMDTWKHLYNLIFAE